jgi:hypothetical protein
MTKISSRFPRELKHSRRADSLIDESWVDRIAIGLFVDRKTYHELATELGVDDMLVENVAKGMLHASKWSTAVTNLIALGVDCEGGQHKQQSIRQKRSTRAKRLGVETVLSIRISHRNGASLETIEDKTGVARKTIVEIIRGRTFNGDEYQPKEEGHAQDD